jgi:hypothetical protein
MQCCAASALLDLLAAAEAVRQDDRIRWGAALVGSSTRSAAAMDTSYLLRSNPNEPAIPQQPDFMISYSRPIRSSTLRSQSVPITAW